MSETSRDEEYIADDEKSHDEQARQFLAKEYRLPATATWDEINEEIERERGGGSGSQF